MAEKTGIATAIHNPVFLPSRPNMAERASIAAYEPGARLSVRLRASPMAADDVRSPGCTLLSMPTNSCIVSGPRTLARLGPDEWLVLGPETDVEQIAADLARALRGRGFSLVDISHRNVGIAVAGSCAREVLNGGCPLDLSEAGFPSGSATRTVLGKAEIVLLRPGKERVYRVECWRSFAPYVHDLLHHAAREFRGP